MPASVAPVPRAVCNGVGLGIDENWNCAGYPPINPVTPDPKNPNLSYGSKAAALSASVASRSACACAC